MDNDTAERQRAKLMYAMTMANMKGDEAIQFLLHQLSESGLQSAMQALQEKCNEQHPDHDLLDALDQLAVCFATNDIASGVQLCRVALQKRRYYFCEECVGFHCAADPKKHGAAYQPEELARMHAATGWMLLPPTDF